MPWRTARLNLDREQVLARLWEIANLSPEMTRGSVTGQVKAISMIVAMENFIPDRRAVSSEKKSPPTPTRPQIYRRMAWQAAGHKHPPAAKPCPACPGEPWGMPWSPARRWVCHAEAHSRLGGRGASEPWPQPVRLRQPPKPFASVTRGPLWPRVLFCSRRDRSFCSRHESPFLYKEEPLCSPTLSCQS